MILDVQRASRVMMIPCVVVWENGVVLILVFKFMKHVCLASVVCVVLACATLACGQAPSFTAAGFVNAASSVGHIPPAIARGELVTIFGTNLSTSTQFIPLGSPNPTQ